MMFIFMTFGEDSFANVDCVCKSQQKKVCFCGGKKPVGNKYCCLRCYAHSTGQDYNKVCSDILRSVNEKIAKMEA